MKKSKLKLKKKNMTILIVIITTIILILLLKNPVSNVINISRKGYDIKTSYKIYKKGIKDIVLDNDYSKTFDEAFNSDFYQEKNLNNYFKLKYYEYDSFLENINKWLSLGYTVNDINTINEKNNLELFEYVSKKYVSDIVKYLEYDFAKVDKYDRYIAYFNGDYKDTIIKVNIGLDKDFYENPNVVKDFSIDLIANKYNVLDKEFIPDNLTLLTKCSEGEEYLAGVAKEAYDLMCDASIKEGLSLGITSSYRSYEAQEKIYNSYLKSNGQDYVNKYVATPGYSEHQTGLAIDVKSLKSSPFKSTKEYKWMIDNSYKYGFILRYPEGKENLTGYNPEAWHFRYVGKEIAEYIHNNNITYEEYCAVYK